MQYHYNSILVMLKVEGQKCALQGGLFFDKSGFILIYEMSYKKANSKFLLRVASRCNVKMHFNSYSEPQQIIQKIEMLKYHNPSFAGNSLHIASTRCGGTGRE